MKERGGCIWLLVGLFLALVAGGLAFTAMLKATAAQPVEQTEPQAPVVIVAQDVPPRTRIAADHLVTKEIPLSAIPANAIQDAEAAIGKVTTSQLIAGEILLEPRLAEPGQRGTDVNFELKKGQVVMAFPADDVLSKTGILQPGDVIDILYTTQIDRGATDVQGVPGEADEESVTFWTLQQVSISAVVLAPESISGTKRAQEGPRPKPESILLGVEPQDALVLKYLKDSKGTIDIVLRARDDDTRFKTVPVDEQYLEDNYITP